MKVLYDISVLGMGRINPRARTGVFRVSENLAYGLLNRNDIELEFCVSSTPETFYHSLKYLEENIGLSNLPFPHDCHSKAYTWELRENLTQLIDETSGIKKNFLKAIRKVLTQYIRSFNKKYEPINPISLQRNSLYHSPFFPFPSQVKESNEISKFLSVMDLIHILYPSFFEYRKNNIAKNAIDGLDSRSYCFTISQSTKDDLCNYSNKIDPNKVFVTHLAAADLFYPCTDEQRLENVRHKYGIPKSPYVLSLSTLEPRKNIDHTIRSFIQLISQEKLDDLFLVLVGGKGWNYDKIFSEISNNPIAKERIILTGYVADEDLAPIYSGALAFVYPSFYEGFGLPPLEAMQCSVPVITSNTSSLPEVVGDAGIMLDPKDLDGLCQGLLDIYQKVELRNLMAKRSLAQAKKFSWEQCIDKTIAGYKVALDS